MSKNLYYVYKLKENGQRVNLEGWNRQERQPIGNATPRWDEMKTFVRRWIADNDRSVAMLRGGEPEYWASLPFGFLACVCGKYEDYSKTVYYVFSEVQIAPILKDATTKAKASLEDIGCYLAEVTMKKIGGDPLD